DAAAVDADRLQLLADHEPVQLAAHRHRRLRTGQTAGPQDRLLIQRALPDQRQELFGLVLTRQRPQPGAAAATEYDRMEHADPPDSGLHRIARGSAAMRTTLG